MLTPETAETTPSLKRCLIEAVREGKDEQSFFLLLEELFCTLTECKEIPGL